MAIAYKTEIEQIEHDLQKIEHELQTQLIQMRARNDERMQEITIRYLRSRVFNQLLYLITGHMYQLV